MSLGRQILSVHKSHSFIWFFLFVLLVTILSQKDETSICTVEHLVNQSLTSLGPECLRMAVRAKCFTQELLGKLQASTKLVLGNTAVQLTME